MGTKGIRLKILLPLLMVAIVLSEATSPEPEVDLPAIIFRKELGTPAKFRGTTFQRSFCAAFPVADGTFLTSTHCLATAPISKSIDLAGLGNVEIEKILNHPLADLTVFQVKNRNVIPKIRPVNVGSDDIDDTCSVLVLDNAFRWTMLHGATRTRCMDSTSKDKICYKSKKTQTGLDFAVICAGGRTLHAIYHGQRGPEISFTDCSRVHCSEFAKLSATRRVKRQDAAATDPAPDSAAAPAGDPAADSAAAPAAEPAAAPAADSAAAPAADTAGAPAADKTASNDTDTGDVPLPPPNQIFPNLPDNFPYPAIDPIQGPPVPTKPRKRLGPPTSVEAAFPELAVNKPITSDQPVNEDPISVEPIPVESDHSNDTTLTEVEASSDSALEHYDVIGIKENPELVENQITADGKQPAQKSRTGNFALAPADWRFSVTPRPQRRCRPTEMPSCNNVPSGPDPWMGAAQDSIPGTTSEKKVVKKPKASRKKRKNSAASNGLAFVALLVNIGLCFML